MTVCGWLVWDWGGAGEGEVRSLEFPSLQDERKGASRPLEEKEAVRIERGGRHLLFIGNQIQQIPCCLKRNALDGLHNSIVNAKDELHGNHNPEKNTHVLLRREAQKHAGDGYFDQGHTPCPHGLGDDGVFVAVDDILHGHVEWVSAEGVGRGEEEEDRVGEDEGLGHGAC